MSNHNLRILRDERDKHQYLYPTQERPRRYDAFNEIPVVVDDNLPDNTIYMVTGTDVDGQILRVDVSEKFSLPKGPECPRCSKPTLKEEFEDDYICYECRYGPDV